jgi:IclR family transcriptional regulator, KDG regulon repressor
MTTKPPVGSQTVDRALELLECFSVEESELSLTEFSNATGLTMPTTHRLLKALQAREYLLFDKATRLYSLGPGAMRLASIIIQRDDINAVVLPWLERLRRLTGETAALHWLVDHYRVCTVELESRHLIKMASGVGRRYPLFAGAAGKAIISNLPEDEILQILHAARDEGTGPLVTGSVDGFMAMVRATLEAGVARSTSEVVDGASAVAAAVLNSVRRPIAAINITGPSSRFGAAAKDQAAILVREAVQDVEQRLGYSSPMPDESQ